MATEKVIKSIENVSLLEKAMRSCKSGVTIADATDPELPLIYINGSFSDITGYPVEEVIGRNCRFLQGEDRDEETRKKIREAINKGEKLTVVLKNYRKNGEPFWNELNLSPIEQEGEITHYVGIQNDITEIVEAKNALEKANSDKEKLLGMAAHDLRNPLAMIKSMTELAHDTEGDDAKEMQAMIEDTCDKAMNLVNDILDYSSIQGGRIDFEMEETNIHDFLDKFCRMAKGMAKMKEIEFEEKRDIDRESIEMDGDRVEQILDNLLTNAIKFSDKGTKIRLNTIAKDDHLTFEMIDEGLGIPEKEMDILFMEFKSTSVKPTENEPSSGLGLAITKHLVDLHEGKIGVESEEGKGSTFRVVIPVKNG